MPVLPRPDDGLRVERVRGFLAEMRGLSPKDLQAIVVTLQMTLGSATSSASQDYKVPGDSDLVILSIHGYLRFTALDSEDTTVLSFLNLDPTERWLVKSQNCVVGLSNVDRNHKFIDNNDITLSALMPPMGYPIVFPPEAPGIVPKAEILRASFALQDTDTDVVSGNTVYGLAITGVLVPRRED